MDQHLKCDLNLHLKGGEILTTYLDSLGPKWKRSEFTFRRGRNIDNISGFSRPKMEKGMNTVHGLWRQRVHKVFWVSCGQTQMVVQRWKLQWLCWEPSYEEWCKHGRTFLKWGCWDSVQSNIIKERLVCYDVFLMWYTLR